MMMPVAAAALEGMGLKCWDDARLRTGLAGCGKSRQRREYEY